ncbi:MAG TPA: LamG-like jellyroll fold domain-containing protein [Kribbella sp.]
MNRVGRLLHVALQRKAGTLSLWVPGVVVVGLGRGDCCGVSASRDEAADPAVAWLGSQPELVDGAPIASVAAPTGSVSPGRPFKMYVGRRLDGLHHFDGSLDEVRIYERALTAAEISSIRTTNATGIPNVVLDLPLG